MHGFGTNTIHVLRVCAFLLTLPYLCSCAASTQNQELQFAAMQGRTGAVNLLVSKGVDVNSKHSATGGIIQRVPKKLGQSYSEDL